MAQKEQKVKEKMFGGVQKARATGGFKPDPEKLLAPFDDEQLVIRSFCTGCGWPLEYFRENAEKLADSAGIKLPGSLEGLFFETASCNLDDGTDPTIHLKKIEDL